MLMATPVKIAVGVKVAHKITGGQALDVGMSECNRGIAS